MFYNCNTANTYLQGYISTSKSILMLVRLQIVEIEFYLRLENSIEKERERDLYLFMKYTQMSKYFLDRPSYLNIHLRGSPSDPLKRDESVLRSKIRVPEKTVNKSNRKCV